MMPSAACLVITIRLRDAGLLLNIIEKFQPATFILSLVKYFAALHINIAQI
jgi:hypothetical protein